MTAGQIAAALGNHKPKSGGGFMACCPAHLDKTPSLAIDDKDGKVLVHCFAGCDQAAVVDALKARDLWSCNSSALPPMRKPVTAPLWRPIMPIPNDAPEPPTTHYTHGKPSHVWQYLSATGDLLHLVYRFDPNDGKQVLPLTYCTDGKRKDWRFKAIPDNRPLYGLELIGDAKHIVIVEGEKATDAARRLLGDKIPVVTWSGGSKATAKANFSPLAGKTIVIWPDADEPGTKAALAVAGHLAALGCTVKIVEPPADATECWDLADAEAEGWVDCKVLNQLKVALSPQDFKAKHISSVGAGNNETPRKPLIEFTDIVDELMNPIEAVFLIDDVIEDCTTGTIFGESTAGKTFIALDMDCCIATGTPWAGHNINRPGPVIYFAGEGRQGIVRRIKAWELSRGTKIPKGQFYLPKGRVEFNKAGAEFVIDEINKLPELPVKISIDTVARSMPSGSDENSAKDMMAFINAVDSIRDNFGCTVTLVHHSGHSGEAKNRTRGSSAFRAAVDWEILVAKKGVIKFTKMKDSSLPDPIGFELVAFGESAVPTYGVAKTHKSQLTDVEELGLTTLTIARSMLSEDWVCADEWRQEFYQRHNAKTDGGKRKAFSRVRTTLTEKDKIEVDDREHYRLRNSIVTKESNKSQSSDIRDKRDSHVTSVKCHGPQRDKRDTPLKGVTVSRPDMSFGGLPEVDVSLESFRV